MRALVPDKNGKHERPYSGDAIMQQQNMRSSPSPVGKVTLHIRQGIGSSRPRCTTAVPLTLLACGWTALQNSLGVEAYAGYGWASSAVDHRWYESGTKRVQMSTRRSTGYGRGWSTRPQRPHGALVERRTGARARISGTIVEDRQGGRVAGSSSSSSPSVREMERLVTVWEDDADAINNGVYTVLTNRYGVKVKDVDLLPPAVVPNGVVDGQEEGGGSGGDACGSSVVEVDELHERTDGVEDGVGGGLVERVVRKINPHTVNGARYYVSPLTKSQAAEDRCELKAGCILLGVSRVLCCCAMSSSGPSSWVK